jgi:hypothetical protein
MSCSDDPEGTNLALVRIEGITFVSLARGSSLRAAELCRLTALRRRQPGEGRAADYIWAADRGCG